MSVVQRGAYKEINEANLGSVDQLFETMKNLKDSQDKAKEAELKHLDEVNKTNLESINSYVQGTGMPIKINPVTNKLEKLDYSELSNADAAKEAIKQNKLKMAQDFATMIQKSNSPVASPSSQDTQVATAAGLPVMKSQTAMGLPGMEPISNAPASLPSPDDTSRMRTTMSMNKDGDITMNSSSTEIDQGVKEARDARIAQAKVNEQDKLEKDAMQRIVSVRGDSSMAKVEGQRDAAAQAYNAIKFARSEGREPSEAEYLDILGQLWKARTNAAPTAEVIKGIKGNSIKSKVAHQLQFWTGKPVGANSKEIIDNLESFSRDIGEQMDRAHEGYMKTHLIKPTGLKDATWNEIKNVQRGQSFKEATDLVTIKDTVTGKISRVSRDQAKEMMAV